MTKFLVLLLALVSGSDQIPKAKVLRAPATLAAGVLFLMMAFGCSAPVHSDSLPVTNGPAVELDDLGGLTLGGLILVSPSDFAQDELEVIMVGIGRWEAATSIPFVVELSEGNHGVRIVDQALDGKLGGMWWKPTLTAYLDMAKLRERPMYLEYVVVHELGHALGLDHAEAGVMVETASRGEQVVDEETLAMLCSLQTCPEES